MRRTSAAAAVKFIMPGMDIGRHADVEGRHTSRFGSQVVERLRKVAELVGGVPHSETSGTTTTNHRDKAAAAAAWVSF